MNSTMSITGGMKEYIQSMIDRIPGMKVLVLDDETLGIISMVYSQSDILQHEVFLVEKIKAEQHEKMRHLNAICFLRPTNDNFLRLTKELKNPKYQEYHLFFTNVVPHARLEQLAAVDEYEVVHQVQEYYADVFAINHDLFSLNLDSTSRLTEERSTWSSYEELLELRANVRHLGHINAIVVHVQELMQHSLVCPLVQQWCDRIIPPI
mmetsp:Transcript_11069/g.15651  ORF Transcript_11069/g.15651 Transcript_11069/m.15651 type:complete len:208 (-) Transcript_11069:188-811(-)